MRKIVLRLTCALLVISVVFGSALALTESTKPSNFEGILENCPFVFKNQIKFGMNEKEIVQIEGASKLEASLGGLDGWTLSYYFSDDILTRIEYKFYFPMPFKASQSALESYTGKQLDDISSWVKAFQVIRKSLADKYGDPTSEENTKYAEGSSWAIKYQDSYWGVDITCEIEKEWWGDGSYGSMRLNYKPHDYLDDLVDILEEKKLVESTSDDI